MTEIPFNEKDPQDEAAERKARLTRIIKEIVLMPKDDATLFTATGKPTTDALTARCGFTVAASDRDVAWDTFQRHTGDTSTSSDINLPIPKDVTVSGTSTEDETWSVIDLAAVRGPRQHQPIPDGPIYTLNASTAVSMPRAHALRFLFPDYRVLNASGEEVSDMPDPSLVTAKKGTAITLGNGEVVAKVTELSDDALLMRALRLPGGDKLGDHSSREDLESFIITSLNPGAAAIKTPDDTMAVEDDDGEGDEVPLPNLPSE